MIICIGREFGSGGHEIGRKVAEKLGLELYDRDLIDRAAEKIVAMPKDVLVLDTGMEMKFFAPTHFA